MKRSRFHPTDPRWQSGAKAAGVGMAAIPAPAPQADAGETIWLPIDKVARVVMIGKDAAEEIRALAGQTFHSSDESVFRVSPALASSGEAVLVPVAPGTATLQLTADADTLEPSVPLSDTLTVIVYSVATELRVYITESGANEIAVPFHDGAFYINAHIGTNSVLRIEGADAAGRVVPLSAQLFDDQGSARYHITAGSDADHAVLVPDSIGEGQLVVTADGDPSSVTSTVTWTGFVEVFTTMATHIVETYAIETP